MLATLLASGAFRFVKAWWPVIVGGLAILVVVMSVLGYGRARFNAGVASMKPALEACVRAKDDAIQANKHAQAAIKALQDMYGDLEQAIRDLEDRERAAQLRVDAARAEQARRERELLKEAVRLKSLLERPAETKEQACVTAAEILREEARRKQQ